VSEATKEVCDFCGCESFKRLRRARKLQKREVVVSSSSNTPLLSELSKCLQCDLVQVLEINRQENLLVAYETAIDETHAENSLLRIRSFKRAMEKINKNLSISKSDNMPKMIDVGCASGEFPYAASLLGYDVVAFEPSRHLSAIGRDRYQIDIRSSPFNKEEFPPNSINIITLWDVLEHVDSPQELLSEIVTVLKPNGLLILNLPMIDTATARIARFKWPFYLHVHLYYFTKKSIRNYLEQLNLQIVYQKSYSQTLSVRYLVRRATGGKIKNFPVNVPMRYWMGQRTIVAQLND